LVEIKGWGLIGRSGEFGLKEWGRGNEDKDNCRLKETEVFE
jgi:hypothetical protein